MLARLRWLRRWEALLLLILIIATIANITQSPMVDGVNVFLKVENLINLFQLSIEKIIIVLIMTFIIINGEIDLSVASIMGLAACVLAWCIERQIAAEVGILLALAVGMVAGAINGFFVAYAGLPSLAVTLAGLITYRGAARILVEDRSINLPDWLDRLGLQPLLGPFPLALLIFFGLFVVALIILQYTAFGRYVYVVGNSKDVANYSGVRVRRVKMNLYIMSGLISALAGLLFAARLGAVRGNIADGFELDIITMVLLGGVSIFGGTGTLYGVGLSVLIILSLRNGMALANISGNTQTSVIGLLLILSVLVPNGLRALQAYLNRRRLRGA